MKFVADDFSMLQGHLEILRRDFDPGRIAVMSDSQHLQAKLTQKIFGIFDLFEFLHTDLLAIGNSAGHTGHGRFVGNIQTEKCTDRPDYGFIHFQFDKRSDNRSFISGLDARPVITQVIKIHTIENRPGRVTERISRLDAQFLDPLKQGFFAMITAIPPVGCIKRILHLLGVNNLQGNVMALRKAQGMPIFSARKRRAVCQGRQHIFSEDQVRHISQ